jgi:hypothetical protein
LRSQGFSLSKKFSILEEQQGFTYRIIVKSHADAQGASFSLHLR